MKKALIRMICMLICLVLLVGCSDKRPIVPPTDNNGGAQAISPSIDPPDAQEKSTPAPSASPEPANSPDAQDRLVLVPSASPEPTDTPPPEEAASDVIEIKEKMFIAQTNDMYINPEDYLGKTIKYEGIFDSYYYDVTDTTYYFVIRYGPGCCSFDANAGFEVVWSGEYPEENAWVEAIGVLEQYEEDGYPYLRLALSSLKVLDTRGAEYVYQ